MISLLILAGLFAASAVLTVTRSAVQALAWVYLPSTILLLQVPMLDIPLLPDPNQRIACIYGILVGMLIRGGRPVLFRWNLLDSLLVTLAALRVLTALFSEKIWTGVSAFGDLALGWIVPYLLARQLFYDPRTRRDAVIVLSLVMVFVGLATLVELRLAPFFYSRLLEPLGIVRAANTFVYHRFGLFRPQVGFAHPIDLGNSALMLASMVTIFAITSGVGLKHNLVRLGLAASIGTAAASLSFTSYVGIAAASLIFVLLYYLPATRMLIVPSILAAVLAAVLFTASLLSIDLRQFNPEPGSVEASLWVRTLIVQNSWNYASQSGLFGYGKTIGRKDLDLDSVDNSYMLFLIRYGWLYLLVWIVLVLNVGLRASRALGVATRDEHRIPIIAAVAGLGGTLAAMYTVWFGFAYETLFILLLGLSNSMFDLLLRSAVVQPAGGRAPAPMTVPPSLAGGLR